MTSSIPIVLEDGISLTGFRSSYWIAEHVYQSPPAYRQTDKSDLNQRSSEVTLCC